MRPTKNTTSIFLTFFISFYVFSCGTNSQPSLTSSDENQNISKFLPDEGNIVFELTDIDAGTCGGNLLGQSNYVIGIYVNDKWYLDWMGKRAENTFTLATLEVKDLGQNCTKNGISVKKSVPVKQLRELVSKNFAESDFIEFHLEFYHVPTSIFASREYISWRSAALSDTPTSTLVGRSSLLDNQNTRAVMENYRRFQKAIVSTNPEDAYEFHFKYLVRSDRSNNGEDVDKKTSATVKVYLEK